MCGRGRFAVLAACLLSGYAKPCSRRKRKRNGGDGDSVKKEPVSEDTVDAQGQAPVKEEEEKEAEDTLIYPVIENLSPAMECPVLFKVQDEDGESRYVVQSMVWGIIPTYLNPPAANDHYRMFNKRIESLQKGEIAPYFKTVLQTKRCVAIFDGFYEWKTVAGKKHPYYVSLGDSQPMKMAGIYEDSNIFDPKTYSVRPARTFSIITGDPCPRFTLHTRQPVFLTDEQVTRWLDCPAEDVFTLLTEIGKNCSDPTLSFNQTIQFHPVTPKVTNAWYQESDCSTFKSIGTQLTSFFKTAAGSPFKAEGAVGEGKGKGVTSPGPSGATSLHDDMSGALGDDEPEGPHKKVKTENSTGSSSSFDSPVKATLQTAAVAVAHPMSVSAAAPKPVAAANKGKAKATPGAAAPASPAGNKPRPITSFFAPSPKK